MNNNILLVTDKVMPYRCAFYREFANQYNGLFKVVFLDAWGADSSFDPTFNKSIKWDNDNILDFNHSFCKSKSLFKTKYSGVDRVKIENTKVVGPLIFYIRTFFGILSFSFIKSLFREKYDVLILEGYQSLNYFLAIIISRILKRKLILRGEAYNNNKKSGFLNIVKKIYLKTILPSFSIICYSCITNKEYYEYYGVTESKFVFVPSAIDEQYFENQRERIQINGNPLRKRYNFAKEQTVFLGVGRFVERKRWMDVIEAVNLIRSDNIVLMLVGDGPEKETMENYIRNENLKNIHIEGFVNQSELGYYYDIADVFVLGSDYDPSPKAVNEALGFGLPLVLSDTIGTANELCINNGYIFKNKNVNDLSEKMKSFLINPAIKDDFSKVSLKLSLEWSIEKGTTNLIQSMKEYLVNKKEKYS